MKLTNAYYVPCWVILTAKVDQLVVELGSNFAEKIGR